MQRITPYLFFILAAAALVMIAVKGDAGFEEEVNPLQAVLVVAGAFAGAHALRFLVKRWMAARDGDDAR
ncbi:hypothetical protein GRI42_01730 [Erythrobacter gaetbuli]|uniref:Uncharacterized protein n=1 Tax=Qipengyuania gaetbuli TaxID=266952 RepID=A0A844XVX9_9SPHN|nr:hypothetical protein [Qipengyuania gaetbuli]MXO50020.1 hypothetical protein [Qipengyuania gaetbuli]